MNYTYTPKTLPDYFRDPDNWPPFDPSGMPIEDQTRYLCRRKGIEALLGGSLRSDAAKVAQCSAAELGRLFKRCASVTDEYPFVGWKGLDKNFRLRRWTLKLATEPSSKRTSHVGKFIELLTDPTICRCLDDAIEGRAPTWDEGITRLARKEVFDIFLKACAMRPDSHLLYPNDTTGNKSGAKRSVYRYIKGALERRVRNYSIWYGHTSTQRTKTGTGANSFKLATLPFDLVHGDAHSWDVIGTIIIQTEHGPKTLAISRLWIVLFLDHVSGLVCGYSVSYEEQVSAVTLERALVSSQTMWKPRKLFGKLTYARGAMLPAGNVSGVDSCGFASLKLDNFSSHYANLIQENGRKSLGFHMHFGAIGAWWTNPRLERLFGVLEQRGIHRLPSSLGSGPSDPRRAKDPVKAAIEHGVEWEYTVDLVETLVTEENVRKGSGRSGMTPLEILNGHINAGSVGFLPRFAPPPHPTAPRLGWLIMRIRIAGSQSGGRNPYIEHQGRIYSHSNMKRDWSYLGRHLTVHIRRDDFYVEAYGPDGTFWGPLVQNGGDSAPTPYETVVTTRRTRNSVDRPEAEELETFRQAHEKQAQADAKSRPRRKSKAATKVAEFDRGMKTAQRTRDQVPVRSAATQADVDRDLDGQEGTPEPSQHEVQTPRSNGSKPTLVPATNIFALGKLGMFRGRR